MAEHFPLTKVALVKYITNSLLAENGKQPFLIARCQRRSSSLYPRVFKLIGDWLFALRGVSGLLYALAIATAMPLSTTAWSQEVEVHHSASSLDLASPAGRWGDARLKPIAIQGKVVRTDGSPEANAVVYFKSNALQGIHASLSTDENGEFATELHVRPESIGNIRIWAVSLDKQRAGMWRISNESAQRQPVDQQKQEIEIVSEELRTAKVQVVDRAGEPITSASVGIRFGYPHVFGGFQTNADGEATIPIPKSGRIETCVAWKDFEGLDFKRYVLDRDSQRDMNAVPASFPFDEGETLVLAGSQTLRVSTIDEEGDALADVHLHVWLLRKPGKSEYLNLSYFSDELSERTGEDGIASFDWFPKWQEALTTVWPSKQGYERTRGNFEPLVDDGFLQIKMPRLGAISGKVVNAEGVPVAGIQIEAAGAGFDVDHAREQTHTDNEGRYELSVPPNQIYLVNVRDSDFVANAKSGFAILPGQSFEGCDFVLRSPTVVAGHLTDESTGEPLGSQIVHVCQYGLRLEELPGETLPNPTRSRKVVCPMLYYDCETDRNGRFEFHLGDGRFDIRPPDQSKAEGFVIAGEENLEINVVAPSPPPEMNLLGIVVDAETGKPMGNVNVRGSSRAPRGKDWRAVSQEDGNFRVRRRLEASYVHALDEDGKKGAIASIDAADRNLLLRLRRLGSASGQLKIADGALEDTPTKLTYGVQMPSEDEGSQSYVFGRTTALAEDGTFELTDLVPGWEYVVYFITKDNRFHIVSEVTVEAGQHKSLGERGYPSGS